MMKLWQKKVWISKRLYHQNQKRPFVAVPSSFLDSIFAEFLYLLRFWTFMNLYELLWIYWTVFQRWFCFVLFELHENSKKKKRKSRKWSVIGFRIPSNVLLFLCLKVFSFKFHSLYKFVSFISIWLIHYITFS